MDQRNFAAGKINNGRRKGTKLPTVLSIIALAFSLAAAYIAIGAQYSLFEARQQVARDLDTLMQAIPGVIAPGQNNGNAPGAAPDMASNPSVPDNEYQARMQKDFEQRIPSATSSDTVSPGASTPIQSMRPSSTGTGTAVDINTLFYHAPSVTLTDPTASGAAGEAWLAVYGGKTYFLAAATGMPALTGQNSYYEAWLVNGDNWLSGGRMDYDPATGRAVLSTRADGDWSNYRTVIITRETAEKPGPQAQILKGAFPETADFMITPEMMSSPPPAGSAPIPTPAPATPSGASAGAGSAGGTGMTGMNDFLLQALMQNGDGSANSGDSLSKLLEQANAGGGGDMSALLQQLLAK